MALSLHIPGDQQERLSASLETPGLRVGSFLYDSIAANDGIWLPPREVWIGNPVKDKIETPRDAYGLVDKFKLLRVVMATLDPDYVWSPKSINAHHFQWPEHFYSRERVEPYGVIPAEFRDLPPLKAMLPRLLENWIHAITVPAKPPTAEVMYYHVTSWNVTKNAFRCAQAMQLPPRQEKRRAQALAQELIVPSGGPSDPVGRTYFAQTRAKYERYYNYYMDRLESIPPEFRLIQPGMEPKTVSARVGRLVLKQSHLFRRAANRAA